MNEEYFKKEHISLYNPSTLMMLKLKLFGKRIVERHGDIEAVWYLYKNKLYMTKYSAWYL